MIFQNKVEHTNFDGIHQEARRTIWFHLYTLFLFTKSDFKTVIFPQSVFALSFAYSHTQSGTSLAFGEIFKWRFPCMLVWIWVHLLVENVANQRLPGSVLEDTENKPWRPLPSGRITPDEAQSVLRILVCVAVAMSVLLGSFEASVTLMTCIWLYNDLDGSGAGPWQRNLLNAAGLSCFGWGAVAVLFSGDGFPKDLLWKWLSLLAAVITTTVHAQDFPDVEGDTKSGRKTMPLYYGQRPSRYGLAILLLLWSVACPAFWHVNLLVGAAPLFIGIGMAGMTAFRCDIFYDAIVWRCWCLWTGVLYLLPLFASARA
ncbi:hypothetical protein HYFRA_00009049 [Hymenoscyphus fraxineus]|uniref:UbiA prenyltransferase n=1 Tax=Hymenoscyphus fraxineus TaxID=746836 RepID=A0A9N9PH98_9HELO|nr:hypothetical protein HYFRA_00009049 [Hymenoscyphus fraxineus]